MSYDRNYFRDECEHINPYLKTFKEIWIHDDLVYSNPDGEGIVLSYTDLSSLSRGSTLNMFDVVPEEYEKLIRLKDFDVTVDYRKMLNGYQFDYKLDNKIKLPYCLTQNDIPIMEYCTVTRSFVIPDIFHYINEGIDEFISLMQRFESGVYGFIGKMKRNKMCILVDGQMYEATKVKYEYPKDERIQTMESVIKDLQDDVEKYRNRTSIKMPFLLARSFMDRDISVYICENNMVYLSKNIELTVDKVTNTNHDIGMVRRLPDDMIHTVEGKIVIKCAAPSDNGTELFPIQSRSIITDIEHPHTGDNPPYRELCVGNIQHVRFTNVEQIVQKFDEIKTGMSVIQINSILSHHNRFAGELRAKEYTEAYCSILKEDYENGESSISENELINIIEGYIHYERREELGFDEFIRELRQEV